MWEVRGWEVGGWAVRIEKSVRTFGRIGREVGMRGLIDVKLVAKVEEKAGGLARETAGAGEGKVGGDQEIVDRIVIDLAGDCLVVAGGAIVSEDGSLVGGGPH